MRSLCLLAFLLVATGVSTRAAAPSSSSADLKVTVQDQTGAALVIAVVTFVDSAGALHTLTVDARGVAAFAALPEGPGELRVAADAFKSYSGPIVLKKGANAFSLQLPLANITAEIVVRQEEADRQGNSFVSTLDERQIAELPDDPDEMEQMLQQMAGPGAVMRINGFRGGQMPPKNQIRQIRFRMNSYAAENHDAGGFGIDIFTKPGTDAWRGMSSFGFRDESLNARNAFAPRLGPEQYRRVGINFNGPLVKNKTSLAVSTDGNFSYDSKTINAETPDQSISAQVRRPSDISNVVVRVEHALTAKQSLMVEVQHHDDERRNLGVGDFDLPSRAYHRDGKETVVRGSLNGLVAPKVANELKVQFSGNTTTTGSLSAAPAVIVLDSFSTGGAGQQSDRTTHAFEVDDNVDFSFSKKHAVRAGLQLESYWYDSLDLQNSNGTFTFASNNAYELALANTYQQRQGGTPINFAQYQLGVYAQDDWTISKKLSLSLGLRQELQNTLGDRLNLAPRVGFTWAPSKWTVRGGWGIFNDWYDSSVYEQTLLVNGVNQSDLVILRAGYPDPYAGAIASVLPPSVVEAAAGLRMPHLSQASVGVERNWGDLRVQTSYMAQRSLSQLRSVNTNAPPSLTGQRPNEDLGTVTTVEGAGRLAVDRLQVNVNWAQPQRRLLFGLNYILSSTKNSADSVLSLPSNSLDPDLDYGPSLQDARHRLFAIASFGLPLKMRTFITSQYASALPYNIITGLDNNGDSVSNDRPAGVGRNSARASATWNLNARLGRTFSFGPPRAGGPQGPMPPGGPIRVRGGPGGPGGDGPRMFGPADPNAGRYSVELYAQAYNILNRVNFQTYSGSVRSRTFGDPVSAGPARRIELGVQFGF